MKRRTFIGSLFAGIGAAFFPWRKRKKAAYTTYRGLSDQEKERIIQEYLQGTSKTGRTLLFTTMAFPIMRRHNYSELARSMVVVEPLPDSNFTFKG